MKKINLIWKEHKWLFIVIAIGLFIRIILNNLIFSLDAASFVIWAKYLTTHSLGNLYEFVPDKYPPYPPLYYFVLRYLGYFIDTFNLWSSQSLTYFIIKLPVFISDVVICVLVYKLAQKRFDQRSAILSAVYFYLNPVIIYNTSVWGQIDSFVAALCATSIYVMFKKKYLISLILYLLACLTKFQSLALLPLFILLFAFQIPKKRVLLLLSITGILAIIPFLPVVVEKGIVWTVYYFYTMPNQYPYTSIYAYNIWSIFGFLTPDTNLLIFGIQLKYIAIAIFWLMATVIIFPLRKSNQRNSWFCFFAAFLLFFAFAIFSTRIHSRYLVYIFPFFAPLFPRYKFQGIILTFLMTANFLLPNKEIMFQPLVQVLNQRIIIYFMVLLGVILFSVSLKSYYSLFEVHHGKKS